MKKIIYFLLVLCLMFSLVACNSENPTTDTDSNANVEEELMLPEKRNIDYFKEYTENDFGQLYELPESEKEFLSHVVDYWRGNAYIQDFVVTDDGSIYHISFGKKFSNGTHHIKIDADVKFIKELYGHFVGSDNNVYEYDYETNSFKRIYIPEQLLDTHEGTFLGYLYGFKNEKLSNVFESNGKFYRIDGNNIFSFDNKKIYSFLMEENIELAYDGTIKTNVGYYQVGEICYESEYADIEDTFEFEVTPCSLSFDYGFVKFEQNIPSIIIVDNYVYMAHLT